MLKAVIIDDEKLGRDSLNFLLDSCCKDSVKVVALAEGVADGLMAIHTHNPDIVFLDIQMKGETGFDLLSFSAPPGLGRSDSFRRLHTHARRFGIPTDGN